MDTAGEAPRCRDALCPIGATGWRDRDTVGFGVGRYRPLTVAFTVIDVVLPL